MPKPLYLHPFLDRRHHILNMNLPSWVSLRGVSPTLGRANYKYLYEMEAVAVQPVFQNYTQDSHRIYVMGHCDPGSHDLSTETGTYETCTTDELAKILRKYRLPLNSRAHIRMHACNSATPGPGTTSFAEELRKDLIKLGYTDLTVRGYRVKVSLYLGWRWGGYPPSMSANEHRMDYPLRAVGG